MLNLQSRKTKNLIQIILEAFPGSYILGEQEAKPFRFLTVNHPRQQKGSYTRERLGRESASAGKSVRKVKIRNKNEGQFSLFCEEVRGERLTAPPTNAYMGDQKCMK